MLIEITDNKMEIRATQKEIADVISLLQLELLHDGVNGELIRNHAGALTHLFNDLGYESARSVLIGALCNAPLDCIVSEAMEAFSPKEEENENRDNRQ